MGKHGATGHARSEALVRAALVSTRALNSWTRAPLFISAATFVVRPQQGSRTNLSYSSKRWVSAVESWIKGVKPKEKADSCRRPIGLLFRLEPAAT